MRFRTIVIDPPWEYSNKGTGGSMKSGAAHKYPTMSMDAICKLPIPKLADSKAGACVYLWITVPLLDQGFEVLKAWGFKYKTCIFWSKIYPGKRKGTGWWYRGNIELVMLGIKGPLKAFRSNIINVFEAPWTKHSRKPDRFYSDVVEPVAPELRLEMFATKERPGWMVWGNDVVGHDSYVDIFAIPHQ